MTRANFSHQDRIFDPRDARPVTLIGAGSVGSLTAFLIAKTGARDITVYDGDFVASHNAPMSLYRSRDLGRPKVEALAELIQDLSGVTLTTMQKMYEGERLSNCSVIACVDSMKARKLIWSKVCKNPTIDLFIDTRTAGAYVEVLSVDPNNREEIAMYEALSYSDEESARQMCGRHGISFSSARAASIASANLARFWTERKKSWRVAERCDTLERVM